MRKYTLVVRQDPEDDAELMGDVPALPGLHVGARSMDVLLERAREAIEAYLDGADLEEYPEEAGTPRLETVEVNVPSARTAGVGT